MLLADEVGLGKTIEACLLLREYLLRGLVKRVLILVPTSLVSQWHEELYSKFALEFSIPPKTATADKPEYWANTDLVLTSLPFAKSKRRADVVTAADWDLVIVDEAHHCKNRKTLNWKLVNQLKRRHLFLLSATPVQNNLMELYNLLTLLDPGHLKTETDFKKKYIRRGSPRDPLNRERLRSLLGEVMIRNTRSLVQMDLPPRYAQTLMAEPHDEEQQLYQQLNEYLRHRKIPLDTPGDSPSNVIEEVALQENIEGADGNFPPLTRRQLSALLLASGSHPRALAQSLENVAGEDPRTRPIIELARRIKRSAKEEKLLKWLGQNGHEKVLVFACFRRTLEQLQQLLDEEGIAFTTL